ncbi:MAG: putative sigma54 specific transcriptional regulator [Bacillota bacterium]|nr:putative sigma54 specific transcriptional regulator [Bacillota bacterium]
MGSAEGAPCLLAPSLLGWQNGQQGAKRVGGQRPLGFPSGSGEATFLIKRKEIEGMEKKSKMAADFIHQNYEVLLEIINCINVGIYITDQNGKTLLVNDESVKTGGLGRDELIGKNMADLVAEGYVTESASLKAIASRTEESIVQQLREDGQVYITGVPLIRNSELELVVCTERDITETMRLKEVLEEKDKINKKYERELEYLRKQSLSADQGLIYRSRSMSNLVDMALRIARWETTVLITGESGTGKEVMASFIYRNSHRNEKPFIKVNCSAIPENLVESEFFGYEKGAFTGASNDGKSGLFELANDGTLFLDEIGELSPAMQSKLLRVIQEREIMRVGGTQTIPIDVRIIAATNVNLRKAIAEGKFREDLYYRLNIIPIEIPALRSRKEDIPPLVMDFIKQFNGKYAQKRRIQKAAVQVLLEYDWPGNIRELKNITERIMLTSDGEEITASQIKNQLYHDLSPFSVQGIDDTMSLSQQVDRFEKNLLETVLSQSKSAYEASKILKVNRATISKKIKKFGIEYNSDRT